MKCKENGGCKYYIPVIENCTSKSCQFYPTKHSHDDGCCHPAQQYRLDYICNKCTLWTPKDQSTLLDFMRTEPTAIRDRGQDSEKVKIG